jgi:hypothetical protein
VRLLDQLFISIIVVSFFKEQEIASGLLIDVTFVSLRVCVTIRTHSLKMSSCFEEP